jgi:hypothetical protein
MLRRILVPPSSGSRNRILVAGVTNGDYTDVGDVGIEGVGGEFQGRVVVVVVVVAAAAAERAINVKALRISETSGAAYSTIKRYFLEETALQKGRCEDLTECAGVSVPLTPLEM